LVGGNTIPLTKDSLTGFCQFNDNTSSILADLFVGIHQCTWWFNQQKVHFQVIKKGKIGAIIRLFFELALPVRAKRILLFG
jgi:hypothetical protein